MEKKPKQETGPESEINEAITKIFDLDTFKEAEAFLLSLDDPNHLCNDLHRKLVAAAKEEIEGESAQSSLRLQDVARFLAALSTTEAAKLSRTVSDGLEALNIPQSAVPGRPKGRKTARLYRDCVLRLQELVEVKGVFARKREMRSKNTRNWSNRFKDSLQEEGWPPLDINYLMTSNTPRQFAIYRTADHFDVEYSTVAKACRLKAA